MRTRWISKGIHKFFTSYHAMNAFWTSPHAYIHIWVLPGMQCWRCHLHRCCVFALPQDCPTRCLVLAMSFFPVVHFRRAFWYSVAPIWRKLAWTHCSNLRRCSQRRKSCDGCGKCAAAVALTKVINNSMQKGMVSEQTRNYSVEVRPLGVRFGNTPGSRGGVILLDRSQE